MEMNIEEILKKHVDDEGKINLKAAGKELKEEQGKAYVPKADFNSKNDEVKRLTEQLGERDTQLEELKKVDVEKLQETIADLETKNKEQADAFAIERKNERLNNAVELALTASRSKENKAAKALLDLDKLELGDDGEVKGLSEQIDAIKESSPFLFDMGQKKGGYNPKGGSGVTQYESFEEAMEADDVDSFLQSQAERKEE